MNIRPHRAEIKKEIIQVLDYVEKEINTLEELSWFNLHYRRFLITLESIKEWLSPPASVLDIGCYPGHLTMSIKYLGYEVVGVGLIPEHFEVRMNKKGINIRKCDIEHNNLPFLDETFDCVLLTEVIEHLSAYIVLPVFYEVKRVLKNNGILILSTPNIAALDKRVLLLFGKELINKEHNREYTLREVENLLKDAGFKIEKKWYSSARDVITHAIPEKFISKQHIFFGFVKHPYWKNIVRALMLPLKLVKPSFQSIIFIVSRK